MFELYIFMFIVVGLFAGFLGGLLGIGGGIIIVPTLILLFQLLEFPSDTIMQVAAGTSLASIIILAGSSAYSHYKKNGINFEVLYYLTPGMVVGAIFGGIAAQLFPSHQLIYIFAFFISLVGCYFLFFSKKDSEESTICKLPSLYLFTLIGLTISSLSSFFGIGGGIITMPCLKSVGLSTRNAISTSAISGFIIAVVGALTFAFVGMFKMHTNGFFGYLYLPAFICIGISSAISARVGAHYAYIFPPLLLNRLFGVLILLIAMLLFFR